MAQDSGRPDFWNTRYRDGVMPWDAGGVPQEFIDYAARLAPGARILVPGCGTGYEVGWLAQHGFAVEGIDFSEAAVNVARDTLGPWGDRVRRADFFALTADERQPPYAWIYERAFLCALPRTLWADYAAQMARLLPPGGMLAGAFFFDTNPKGPPFGTSAKALHALLDGHFELIDDYATQAPLPVFAGRERWMSWRRRPY